MWNENFVEEVVITFEVSWNSYHRIESQIDLISFWFDSCSKVLPVEDDLVFRIGHRGRSKGQFTNPQV